MSFDDIWKVPDAHVESGRIPGYVAAVRIGGRTEVRAGGRMAIDVPGPPVREDPMVAIASANEAIGGALTLALVADCVLALDAPMARREPLVAPRRAHV